MGGGGLIDLKAKDMALKMQWVFRAYENENYQNLADTFLKSGIGKKIWEAQLNIKHVKMLFPQMSFWNNVLSSWSDINFERNPDGEMIESQLIWYNSNILINNNPILYKQWFDNGIVYVKDLRRNKTEWLSIEEIRQKYQIHVNFLQYNGLLRAISQAKTGEHENVLTKNTEKTIIQRFLNHKNRTSSLYRNLKQDEKLLQERWIRWSNVNVNVTYDDLVKLVANITKTTICVKLRSFQYRILTRALTTNIQLYYYKIKDSKMCSFCKTHDESMKHLFFECTKIKPIIQILEELTNRTLDYETLILNSVEKNPKRVENAIVLIAKHYIYKSRMFK